MMSIVDLDNDGTVQAGEFIEHLTRDRTGEDAEDALSAFASPLAIESPELFRGPQNSFCTESRTGLFIWPRMLFLRAEPRAQVRREFPEQAGVVQHDGREWRRRPRWDDHRQRAALVLRALDGEPPHELALSGRRHDPGKVHSYPIRDEPTRGSVCDN